MPWRPKFPGSQVKVWHEPTWDEPEELYEPTDEEVAAQDLPREFRDTAIKVARAKLVYKKTPRLPLPPKVTQSRVYGRPGNSKLSDKDVAAIKAAFHSGLMTQSQIASLFPHVHESVITLIVHGKTYADVPIPNMPQLRPPKPKRVHTTPEIVSEIRALYATGDYSQKELCAKFGLSPASICRIVNNKA